MKKILLNLTFLFAILTTAYSVNANEVSITINGSPANFESHAFILNNRTYVPMRGLFENIGAKVTWDNTSKSATAILDNTSVSFTIDSNTVTKDGKSYWSDSQIKLIDGKTYVPIRIILELFGFNVNWNDKDNSVDISTPENSVQQQNPSNESYELKVLELVNIERGKNGLSPLSINNDLSAVARMHSKDMNDRNFFSHTNPDGLSPFDRMKKYGISYRAAGENIAAGQATPEQVVDSWMNSKGHRENILNPTYHKIGIGYYNSGKNYVHYWTQCFSD